MAVPKRKQTRAQRGNRGSHDAIKPVGLSICPNCQETKPNHQVCPKCGWYKGREVLEIEE